MLLSENTKLTHDPCSIPEWIKVTVVECVYVCSTDLFTLAVQVDEGVAGRRDVLRCHTLVHAVDVEVETTVGVHQQTQHRPLRTSVQIRTIVLTDLCKKGRKKKVLFQQDRKETWRW